MSEQVEWTGIINFKGTPEKLQHLLSGLVDDISIIPNTGKCDGGICGGDRFNISNNIETKSLTATLTKRIASLPIKPFPSIAGGLMTPHFHLKEGIALLDHAQFKEIVGELTRELAFKQVESIKDHAGMMKHLNRLAEGL